MKISASQAKLLADGSSGVHAWISQYILERERPDTPSMQTGRDIHDLAQAAITGGACKVEPAYLTKAQCGRTIKQQKEDFRASLGPGEVCLPAKLVYVFEALQSARGGALKEIAESKDVLFEAKAETSKMRGHMDILIAGKRKAFDIKSSGAAAAEFGKWDSRGLAIQQVVYEELFRAGWKAPLDSFKLIYVGTNWPHEVALFSLDPEYVSLCRRLFFEKIMPLWESLSGLRERMLKLPLEERLARVSELSRERIIDSYYDERAIERMLPPAGEEGQ